LVKILPFAVDVIRLIFVFEIHLIPFSFSRYPHYIVRMLSTNERKPSPNWLTGGIH
jgi:hypothetical protein